VERTIRRGEAGQTLSEYVLMVGAIALVVALAVMFLGDRIQGLFGSSAEPIATTPVREEPPALSYPTTLADCENGGWRNYTQFASEADCTHYVEGLAP
jgi:Flp pilus assembly pilin Flp